MNRYTVAAAAIALVAMFTSESARAEGPTFADRDIEAEDDDRTFGVFFNPLGAAVGVYGGEVDFVVAQHVSLNLQGAIYRIGDTTAHGVGFGAQLFPMRGAFHGFYLYPQLAYAHASSDLPDVSASADVLGIGGTVGWQWTWDYGFSFRLGGGAMWFAGSTETATDGAHVQLALTGARPVVDASLGWTF